MSEVGSYGVIRHLPWLLVAGALAAGLGNLITTALAPETSFISDTISDAAAGPFDWVQDAGFFFLSVGLVAQALAMWRELGGWKTWALCCVAFTVQAIALVLIAAVHEYGDGDPQGAIVHYWAVYALGGAFTALLILSIPRLTSADRLWLPVNIAVAVLWVAGSVYFFNMGTEGDGIVERGLAVLQGVWLILFAARTAWQLGSRPIDEAFLPRLITAREKTDGH